MSRCPVCGTDEVYASHRLGFLERGPLSWVCVLPFRCGQCDARFHRFAPGARARRAEKAFETGRKEAGGAGTLHGIEVDSPGEISSPIYRVDLPKRARRVRRRVCVGLISLAMLALAAYGLVWLIDEFRSYRPRYYEPKDIERQQHQLGQAGQVPVPPADR